MSHFHNPSPVGYLKVAIVGVKEVERFSSKSSTEACEKSSRWLWKESYVSTGVRKLGTCASPTLAVKVALNPNTTKLFSKFTPIML